MFCEMFTSNREHAVQCRGWIQLDDLNYADDLALLSNTYEQMQMKTTSVATASKEVGCSMHKGKSTILKSNTENTNQTPLHRETP